MSFFLSLPLPSLFRHIINLLTILARPASRQPTTALPWQGVGQSVAGGRWQLVETTYRPPDDVVPSIWCHKGVVCVCVVVLDPAGEAHYGYNRAHVWCGAYGTWKDTGYSVMWGYLRLWMRSVCSMSSVRYKRL